MLKLKVKDTYTTKDVMSLTGIKSSAGITNRLATGTLPQPDERGGGRRPHKWKRSTIKEYLDTTPVGLVKSHKGTKNKKSKKWGLPGKGPSKILREIAADSGVSFLDELDEVKGYPLPKGWKKKKPLTSATIEPNHPYPFHVVDLYEAPSFSTEEGAIAELIRRSSSPYGSRREYAIVKVTHGVQTTIKAKKLG